MVKRSRDSGSHERGIEDSDQEYRSKRQLRAEKTAVDSGKESGDLGSKEGRGPSGGNREERIEQ